MKAYIDELPPLSLISVAYDPQMLVALFRGMNQVRLAVDVTASTGPIATSAFLRQRTTSISANDTKPKDFLRLEVHS